jgi:hypothetical protein
MPEGDMFREIIGKRCDNAECGLRGQMQDAGLPICPDCGSELAAVTRTKYHLIALFLLAALVLLGGGATFAYGMAGHHLSAGQTVCWLSGRCVLTDGLAVPAARGQWFHGTIEWSFHDGRRPDGLSHQYLCEARDGPYWCRPRFTSAKGDRLHFELYPEAANLYVFYVGPGAPVKLYPESGKRKQAADPSIHVPFHAEMELAGPANAERFAIVASKRPLPELAGVPETGIAAASLADLLRPLSNDKDSLVMYVEIPHN